MFKQFRSGKRITEQYICYFPCIVQVLDKCVYLKYTMHTWARMCLGLCVTLLFNVFYIWTLLHKYLKPIASPELEMLRSKYKCDSLRLCLYIKLHEIHTDSFIILFHLYYFIQKSKNTFKACTQRNRSMDYIYSMYIQAHCSDSVLLLLLLLYRHTHAHTHTSTRYSDFTHIFKALEWSNRVHNMSYVLTR